MRTLVTGATGRVGSRFVPRLLRDPSVERVRVLARDPAKAAVLPGGVEVVPGDITEATARAEALSGVDAVVHLAANLRGGDPEAMPRVNVDGTAGLARDALAAGARRFVFISTNLVYGAGGGRPAAEDDPVHPAGSFGPYPKSKVDAEQALLRLHRQHGLPLRILRSAFVYGEGDPHLEESLRWASEWAAHKRLHMVHHADVAQALLRLLHANGVDGRVYNVADDAPVTALELFELNGREPPAEVGTRPLDQPWEGIVSTRRIRAELGFRPIYPTAWSAWHAGAL